MITISTGNYSTTELKVLLMGIFRAQYLLCQSEGCKLERCCKAPCKSYTMCTDLDNTVIYLIKRIKAREALERSIEDDNN